jgi:hypothetical protein
MCFTIPTGYGNHLYVAQILQIAPDLLQIGHVLVLTHTTVQEPVMAFGLREFYSTSPMEFRQRLSATRIPELPVGRPPVEQLAHSSGQTPPRNRRFFLQDCANLLDHAIIKLLTAYLHAPRNYQNTPTVSSVSNSQLDGRGIWKPSPLAGEGRERGSMKAKFRI